MVRGDDGLHDGKPNPAAFALTLPGRIDAIKTVKQLWQMRLRDRRAGVFCHQLNVVIPFSDGDRYRFPFRRIAQGVGEQIIDCSSEHLRIAFYQAGHPVKFQRDVAFFRPGFEEIEDFHHLGA